MRRASRLRGPLTLITGYYAVLLLLAWYGTQQPAWSPYMPFGGIDLLAASDSDRFEVVASPVESGILRGYDAVRLALAVIGATLLMVPVSWVYFITTRTKRVDRSFAQTIVVLPTVVAGIAVVVANSLALAFSLAGIFAAVRFRFTLDDPAHSLYIFLAIVVGLGAGVGALGVALVTSIAFVYITLTLWKIEYGANLTAPFFAFLTGRDDQDEEL